MISSLAGLLIGLPFGSLLDYAIGFLVDPNLVIGDTIGWTVFFLKIGLLPIGLGWGTAVVLCGFLCRRKDKSKSTQEIRRIILGTVFFPLALMYTLLILGLVNTSIDGFLLQRFGVTHTYSIGIVVLTPFVILFVAVFVPDSKVGIALRRFTHHIRVKRS